MFNRILRVGLFLSLVLYFPYARRIDTEEVVAGFILMVIIGLSFFSKPKRDTSLKMLAAAFLAIVVTSIFHLRFPAWRMLANLSLGLFAVKVIADRFDFNYKSIGRALVAYVIVSNVLIILQVLGLPNYFDVVENQISGTTAIPWVMGVSAVLSLPYLFQVDRYYCLGVLPMIYYSHSIACFILFLLGMAYLLGFFRGRKVIIATAGILAIGVLYFFIAEKHMDIDRVQAWWKSLDYFHNPITGTGFGTWAHQGFTKTNGLDIY